MSGEFHCHLTAGEPAHGGEHARYITRQGKFASRLRTEVLVAAQAGNMPAWAAHDPNIFWDCADLYERKNGTPYSEIDFNLPSELTFEQQIALVDEIRKAVCGSQHAYSLALHYKLSEKTGQPHLGGHLMYSERIDDGIERDPAQYFSRAAVKGKDPATGGCRKLRGGMDRKEKSQYVEDMRARVCEIMNKHLAMYLHAHRYDHRSFERRGIVDRVPQQHVPMSKVRRLPRAERQAIVEAQLLRESLALDRAERQAASLAAAGLPVPADLAGHLAGLREAVGRSEVALAAVGGPVPVERLAQAPQRAQEAAPAAEAEPVQPQALGGAGRQPSEPAGRGVLDSPGGAPPPARAAPPPNPPDVPRAVKTGFDGPDLDALLDAVEAAGHRVVAGEAALSKLARWPSKARVAALYNAVPVHKRPTAEEHRRALLERHGLPTDPAALPPLLAARDDLPAALAAYEDACRAYEAAGGVLPQPDPDDDDDQDDGYDVEH